jgi:DNA-binding LacI/PurR family transcriptional regulator
VTIADIAREAGVSKGAVSYALNGLPGVSASTRARVLAIANELGWYPNRAARALSAARADACGLVVARPARMLALEPFFMEFVSGVEAELSARSVALTIQLAHDPTEEIEIYRRWWAERRVDGVMVYDPRVDDPRVPALIELGLPAVVVGGPIEAELPSVWHDELSPVVEAVRYLAALGHTRIARVAGLGEFDHTTRRTRAFEEVVGELGIVAQVVDTDYTPESGARETRRLLSLPEPPTGILFDSDLLAVTGLGVAHQMGFSVPDDVSIVAWDDSLVCQVVHPPLTAMMRDIPSYGSAVARRLLAEIDGEGVGDVEGQRAELVPRGSTGPVR